MGIALSRPIEEDLVARGADGANAYVGPACHVDAIAATAICDIIVVRRCRRVAIITKVVDTSTAPFVFVVRSGSM